MLWSGRWGRGLIGVSSEERSVNMVNKNGDNSRL